MDVNVRIECIPAHKYLGIWETEAQNYFSFWEKHDCEKVTGMIDSLNHKEHPIITGHTSGWFWENGKRGYFYGLGVSADYDGEIPEGFSIREFPQSYYMVFCHPAFDFMTECEKVVGGVEEMAWNFDPATKGYRWNEEICQDYQRLLPDTLGYEVLRPIVKL